MHKFDFKDWPFYLGQGRSDYLISREKFVIFYLTVSFLVFGMLIDKVFILLLLATMTHNRSFRFWSIVGE
jgi:hypothetical protein